MFEVGQECLTTHRAKASPAYCCLLEASYEAWKSVEFELRSETFRISGKKPPAQSGCASSPQGHIPLSQLGRQAGTASRPPLPGQIPRSSIASRTTQTF